MRLRLTKIKLSELSLSDEPENLRLQFMKAKEFDKKFDEGEADIVTELDLSTAIRSNQRSRRVSIDFPSWMVTSLDREARRLGVTTGNY